MRYPIQDNECTKYGDHINPKQDTGYTRYRDNPMQDNTFARDGQLTYQSNSGFISFQVWVLSVSSSG